jgi:hypothetical protein
MSSALRRLASNTTYGVKTRVARYPSIVVPLERLRGHGALIDDRTDIVIEGFPRCASSFVVAAFRLAQEPREMHIVDHTHEPAQVIRGVRRGIPTLVLIRPAKGAIVSLLIRKPLLSVGAALRGYLRFYEPLVPLRDGFVTATFDEVLRDLGGPIERLNHRFGTSFAPFVHTPEHLARIEREIEDDYRTRVAAGETLERMIPRPSAVREQLKRDVERRFDELAPEEDLRRAAEVYVRLTED